MLRFETLSGELAVRAEPRAEGADPSSAPLLCMDFPCAPAVAEIPDGAGPGSELIEVAQTAACRQLRSALMQRFTNRLSPIGAYMSGGQLEAARELAGPCRSV
jgi:hypothetical protein